MSKVVKTVCDRCGAFEGKDEAFDILFHGGFGEDTRPQHIHCCPLCVEAVRAFVACGLPTADCGMAPQQTAEQQVAEQYGSRSQRQIK